MCEDVKKEEEDEFVLTESEEGFQVVDLKLANSEGLGGGGVFEMVPHDVAEGEGKKKAGDDDALLPQQRDRGTSDPKKRRRRRRKR